MKHQHIEMCLAHSLMYNYLLYFTNALKYAIFYLQRTLSISAPANVGPQPLLEQSWIAPWPNVRRNLSTYALGRIFDKVKMIDII